MENRDTLFRNFILYWFLFFQHGAKVMFVWLLIVLYFLCVESPPSNLCCYSFSIQVTHQTSFYTVSYSTKQNLSNPLHTTIDPSLPKLISKSILHILARQSKQKYKSEGHAPLELFIILYVLLCAPHVSIKDHTPLHVDDIEPLATTCLYQMGPTCHTTCQHVIIPR